MTKALEHREDIMKTLTFPKKKQQQQKKPKEKSHKAVPQIKNTIYVQAVHVVIKTSLLINHNENSHILIQILSLKTKITDFGYFLTFIPLIMIKSIINYRHGIFSSTQFGVACTALP